MRSWFSEWKHQRRGRLLLQHLKKWQYNNNNLSFCTGCITPARQQVLRGFPLVSSPEDYLTPGRGASHRGSFPTLPPPHPQTNAHEKPLLQGKQVWITQLWMGGGSKCKLWGQRVFDKNSSMWAKSDIYTWTRCCWYQGSVWKMLTARDAAL